MKNHLKLFSIVLTSIVMLVFFTSNLQVTSVKSNAVDNNVYTGTLDFTDDALSSYNDFALTNSSNVWSDTNHSQKGFDAFVTMANSNVDAIETSDYAYSHYIDSVSLSGGSNTLYAESVIDDSVGRDNYVRDYNGDHTASAYTNSGKFVNQGWPYGYGGKDITNGAIRVGLGTYGSGNSFNEDSNGINIKFADNIYVIALRIDFGPFFKADVNLTYPNYTEEGCYSLNDYISSNTGLKIVDATSTADNKITQSNGDLVPVTLADYSDNGVNDNRITYNMNSAEGEQIIRLRPSCTTTSSSEFNHDYMARVLIRSIEFDYYSIETNDNRGIIDFTNDNLKDSTSNHNAQISNNTSLLKTYANTRNGDPTTNTGLVTNIAFGNTKAYTEFDYLGSTGIDGQINCVKTGASSAKGTAPTGGIHIGTGATADNASYITFTLSKFVKFISIDFGPYIQTFDEYNDYINSDVGIIVHSGAFGSYTETATAAASNNDLSRVSSLEDTETSFVFANHTQTFTIDINSNTGGTTRRIMLRLIRCYFDTTPNNNVIDFIESLSNYKTCTEYQECYDALISTYNSLDDDAKVIMHYYFIKDYSSTAYETKDIAVNGIDKWYAILTKATFTQAAKIAQINTFKEKSYIPVLIIVSSIAAASLLCYILISKKSKNKNK